MFDSKGSEPPSPLARHGTRLIPSVLFVGAVAGAVLLFKAFATPAVDVPIHEKLEVDGQVRNYRVVVPRVASGKRLPVVYAFHGVGDSPEAMAQYSSLDGLAVTEEFVLVYPAAQNSMWASGDLQQENADSNADVRFWNQLHEEIQRRRDVDANRVYFVGMSNGGEFAQAFGSLCSHVTGVISHSAARPRRTERALRPFPLLLIVGDDDPVAERVASDAEAYRAAGHEVELVTVPDLGHAWAPEANRAIARFLREHD